MLISGVLFFLMTIALKNKMSPNEFGNIALLLTIISSMWSFGLFGTEQVFLRHANIHQIDKVSISYTILWHLLFAAILGAGIFTSIFIYYKVIKIPEYFVYLVSLSILMLLFSYNYFRLRSNFNAAQLYSNGWKIISSLVVLLYMGNSFLGLNGLELLMAIAIVTTAFIAGVHILLTKPYCVNDKTPKITSLAFQFFTALLLLNILTAGDRFVIDYFLGIEAAGHYYYYLTVALFPFSFLQSYLGFKELPAFKHNFSMGLVHEKIVVALKLATVLAIIVCSMGILISSLPFVSEKLRVDDIWLFVLLVVTGIIRIIYSIVSSAMGARATTEQIKRINKGTAISVVCFLIIGFFMQSFITLYFIAFIFLVLYIIRVILFYRELEKNAAIV